MRLELFKSLWGVVRADGGQRSVADVVSCLPSLGYAGVECSLRLAHDSSQQEGLLQLLADRGLAWIPILFSSGPVNGWSPVVPHAPVAAHDAAPAAHAAAIGRQLEAAQKLASTYGVAVPFFNLHSGHDSFPEAASLEYLQGCATLAEGLGVRLVHEIHRGRIFHNPWATARLAARLPHLQLVADYSHFTAACEVEPWDPTLRAALQKLTPHITHLHARVGYENGPQVPDPRCPHWQPYTDAFEQCWADIWRHSLNRRAAQPTERQVAAHHLERVGPDGTLTSSTQAGEAVAGLEGALGVPAPEVLTATPEYGPPSYQHVLPFPTGQGPAPTADVEAVNEWTRERLLSLFAQASAEQPAVVQQ